MTVNLQFANLDPHVQDKFIAIARKDPEGRTAAEWFEHLVPEQLQDSSEQTEVFMDGGTVTREEWVYDQGRGGGHYETVEYDIGDRDVSRIESGHNGGDYTHDNTIMEDSSINRSRGADNMTPEEYDAAVEANAMDADLIDSADVATEQLAVTNTETLQTAPDILGNAVGTAAEAAVAGLAAYKVGEYVYKQTSDWKPQDRAAATIATSSATLALAFTPPGQAVIAVYAGFKLIKLGATACSWVMSKA